MIVNKNNTDKFRIRKAIQVDIPVVVDFLVRLALHVEGKTPHTLRKKEQNRLMSMLSSSLLDPNKLLVVAEAANHRLVGTGYLYVWRSQGIWKQTREISFKSGIIDNVWVEPDFRKRGVFSAILLELLAFAESHDIEELIIEYAASNKEAEATWSRMGFKPTGIRAAAFTTDVQNALEKQRPNP